MNNERKQEVITFKVDANLSKAMEDIPNRSEFIRMAILTALNNTCPLCSGRGTLTMEQQKHWENFTENHTVEKCDDCRSLYIVCDAGHE